MLNKKRNLHASKLCLTFTYSVSFEIGPFLQETHIHLILWYIVYRTPDVHVKYSRTLPDLAWNIKRDTFYTLRCLLLLGIKTVFG